MVNNILWQVSHSIKQNKNHGNRQRYEMGLPTFNQSNKTFEKNKPFFFQKILNIWYIYKYLSEVQCTKLRYVKKKPPDIFTTYSNQKS